MAGACIWSEQNNNPDRLPEPMIIAARSAPLLEAVIPVRFEVVAVWVS